MTSKKVEGHHVDLLEKVLTDAGIQCRRSAVESSESSFIGEEEQVEPTYIEEAISEQTLEEELPVPESITEELPAIFPTPSLRRVLPDHIRKIEDSNRIHVLPDKFKTDINPDEIPKISSTPPQRYIEILAELTGCERYTSSLPEYWFLDTLAGVLRRGQKDGLDRPIQAILINWVCEWMKEMQHFDAADRPRMIRRWEDNMLAAARFIVQNERVPTPLEAGVYYEALPEVVQEQGQGEGQGQLPEVTESNFNATINGPAYDCAMRDLTSIFHYIYDLFSSDYQYNMIRTVFTFSPGYQSIDIPHQLQVPKQLYSVVKPKKEKPKKEVKPKEKGKKQEVEETAEFLALMELKTREERALEELAEKEFEDYNRRSHILPLVCAADDELFDKYWPPPPPGFEPETSPRKGKKGK